MDKSMISITEHISEQHNKLGNVEMLIVCFLSLPLTVEDPVMLGKFYI